MRQENQQKRREEIEISAYELLAEKGYSGASMLSIAKRAKASNETLYRWYGDKQGLFLSLVQGNLQGVKTLFEHSEKPTKDGLLLLESLGPQLLTLLTGQRAIILNRAAAADVTGQLGAALAKGGRNIIMPLIAGLFKHHLDQTGSQTITPQQASETYIGLLIGDLQIRRVIGVLGPLDSDQIMARANWALFMVRKLLE